MALDDPQVDPDVSSQLYGDAPAAVNDPTASPSPWDWVPDHWGTDEAAIGGAGDPGIGGDMGGAIGPSMAPDPNSPGGAPLQEAPPPATEPIMQDPTPQAQDPAAAQDPATGAPLAPGAVGPQGPPPPGLLDGSFFAPPPPPPDGMTAPMNPADAAGADLPPLPPDAYGAPPPPPAFLPDTAGPDGAPAADASGAAPAGPPPVLGPQLPPRPTGPIATPYGWDPLAGTEWATKHIDPTAENPFDGVSDSTGFADASRLALEHPTVLAQLAIEQEQRRKIDESRERIRIDNEDVASLKKDQADRAEADARTRRQSDQIAADAQKLAQKPLDRHRWFKNQSTLGKILSVFAAVVGGLASQRGGPNLGLEFVNKQIDDDIADQKADIENQRGGLAARQTAVGQEFARTGNLYQAAETVRLAVRQAAVNKLQTEQQNFDPRGTGYLEYGKQIQGMQAGMAQAQEAQRKTGFTENLQVIKAQGEAEAQAESKREHLASEALARQKEYRESAAAAAKSKAEKEVLTPQQIAQQFPSLPVAAIPPGGSTVADLGKHVETFNKTIETATKTRENTVNDASTIVRNPITGDSIIDSHTGQPARMRAEDATKFSEEIGKSQQFVDTLAEVRRKLDADPSSIDRDKWSAITTQYERAKVKFIGSAGAKPSSREMQAVEEMMGTNFHDFKDRVTEKGKAMSRIDALIDGTQQDILTDAQQRLGYKGAPLLRDTSRPPKHAETPDESKTKEVFENPDKWDGERVYQELGLAPEETSTLTAAGAQQEKAQRFRELGGILPSQRATIDAWRADAAGGDDIKRQAAIANLSNAARVAELPGVRAYANDALVSGAANSESPAVDDAVRAVGRETAPPVPIKPIKPVEHNPRAKR